jgi:hypothetical protein
MKTETQQTAAQHTAPMKLSRSISLGGRTVELFERSHGGKYWYLWDYQVRLNGKPKASFSRCGTIGAALNEFEVLAHLRFAGYPFDDGSPVWRHHKTNKLYRIKSCPTGEPSVYIEA